MCSHATIELFLLAINIFNQSLWEICLVLVWTGLDFVCVSVCLCYVNVRKAACTDLFILSVYISNTG